LRLRRSGLGRWARRLISGHDVGQVNGQPGTPGIGLESYWPSSHYRAVEIGAYGEKRRDR
jgi:hypothetical protein